MSVRRFLPVLALGCGAYIAFVISMLPAATALRWLAPEAVRASNVTGTVWSGSAALASIGELALRDLRWEIRAAPLLLARLSGTAQAGLPGGFANTQFVLSGGEARLTGLQLSTTLALLSELLPISGANGALSARIESLVIEDQWPTSVTGSVRVSDLIVEPLPGLGSQLIALGSYEADLAPTPGAAAIGATIRDLGGPLEVSAQLVLTRAREYRLEGTVSERASASEALVQGLNFMTGEPGADGRRPLLMTGSL